MSPEGEAEDQGTGPGPAEHGFGLYGPDFGYPDGGFCVSVFLVLLREDRLLVGRMRDEPVWEESWAPNLRYYKGARRKEQYEALRIPATYLHEGEHPHDAARRVWHDQLGMQGEPPLESPFIVSETGPSRRSPGAKHWDLLFLYVVRDANRVAEVPKHWASLAYKPLSELSSEEMGMLHGELLPHLQQLVMSSQPPDDDPGTSGTDTVPDAADKT